MLVVLLCVGGIVPVGASCEREVVGVELYGKL